MSDIIDFKPKAALEAAEQLEAFIAWAKATLPKGIPNRVHEGIQWDMNSWHTSGMTSTPFTAFGSPRKSLAEHRQYMLRPLMDFAKAILVYHRVYRGQKSVRTRLDALRVLEIALVELTGAGDVTQVTAAVCNRACEYIQARWQKGNNAYIVGKSLEDIIKFMAKKGLLAKPIRWASSLERASRATLKQQKANSEKKLPSRESLLALGELFNNNLTSPMDIVVTSACALLLSQPARIGELADVERDPIVFKERADGSQRMFLRWFGEKGFGATLKPVVTGMESVVECLIERMLTITDDARAYAAWLEDHPDEFPPHDGLPDKGLDDPLTYEEVCSAIKITAGVNCYRSYFKHNIVIKLVKKKPLGYAAQSILNEIQDGWDTSKGHQLYAQGKRGVQRVEFNDKAVITLRKLNILMREKYLPSHFPYTTPSEDGKKRMKYRDALFTVRTGDLIAEGSLGKPIDFGVEIAAKSARMTAQLSSSGNCINIFDRHGYTGVRVNTHAFRHELNTEMHRAGLSQLLIDAFSGRTSMGSVYNHETVEERTQAVAAVHPKTKQSNAEKRLEMVRTNAPIRLIDVTDLAEGSQDRVVHQTHLGICVHNFAGDPCPKMGACLRCGKLACVKGDDEKLNNIKEERDYLRKRFSNAIAAESRGEFGATKWVTQVRKDLLKCDALIKLIESPELENGDIVWNPDDGWNLTNNAAAMAGLVEPHIIEAKDQETLPSLDDLSAMLDEIEV